MITNSQDSKLTIKSNQEYELPEKDQAIYKRAKTCLPYRGNLTEEEAVNSVINFSKTRKKNPAYLKDVVIRRGERDRFLKLLESEYGIREEDLDQISKSVLFHILECSLDLQYQVEFKDHTAKLVPIPKKLRDSLDGEPGGHERYFKPLREIELIKIHPYNKQENLCYRYEVDSSLLENYKEILINYTEKALSGDLGSKEGELCYAATGESYNISQGPKTNLYVNSGNKPLNNLQTEAVSKLEGYCRINVGLFYEKYGPRRGEIKEKIKMGNSSEEEERELEKIEHDIICIARLQQRPHYYELQRIGNKDYRIMVFWQYFNLSSPLGRLYDIQSAYINISSQGKMQLRYCKDSTNRMQWNYDLKACYNSICLGLGEKYGLKDPLFHGQGIKKTRKKLARQLSLSEKVIKGLNLSLIFGAALPTPNTALRHLKCNYTIARQIFDAVDGDETQFLEVVKQVYKLLKPYQGFIEELTWKWLQDPKNRTGNNQYLVNGVGRYLTKNKDWENRDNFNEVRTFMLQGIEGGFIQYIIANQERFNYNCSFCEHDGLVVSGEIPQDVIEEAKENAGFKYAELESKENPHQEQEYKENPHQEQEYKETLHQEQEYKETLHQEQEYYENEKSVENTNIPSTTKGNYKESIIKIVIRVNNFLKQHNPMNIFKKKHNRKLHPTPT